MPTINGRACVANGVPVDKVFSNGKQVYGRNLYVDTKSLNVSYYWANWLSSYKTEEKFNGLTVMGMKIDWGGLGQHIQAKKGEIYTFSAYARYESGTGNSSIFFQSASGNNTNPVNSNFSLNETWQRIKRTFTVTADSEIIVRMERSADNTNTLLIAGIKLERGDTATPYSLAPEDVM